VGVGYWRALGRISYREGLEIQDRVAGERLLHLRPDTLLLLEHPPTITLGRRGSRADILWSEGRLAHAGISVERVRRGGFATYHGPGQLVGYVIAVVGYEGRGVRKFVRTIEQALCQAVREFGLHAEAGRGGPGLWLGSSKVASIGIEVRRRISRHGFAVNVDMDLEPFRGIVPCGAPGLAITDLSRAAGRRIAVAEVERAVVRAWRDWFGEIEEDTVMASKPRVEGDPVTELREGSEVR
jgi:lipoate-protein ligase B